MNCPICKSAAENITDNDFDGKIISCPKCEEYEISGTVENRFSTMSKKDRERALEKAKKFARGNRPSINTMCL